jgi:hypothetical protein
MDGGTTNQVFLFPTEMRMGGVDAKLGIDPVRRLYIIRNGRVAPEFKAVKASTLAIAGRSISTLIKTQGIGDLYQMYELAQRNRIANGAILTLTHVGLALVLVLAGFAVISRAFAEGGRTPRASARADRAGVHCCTD